MTQGKRVDRFFLVNLIVCDDQQLLEQLKIDLTKLT